MVLSLLFNKKYSQTQIAGVFLDATLSENHEFSSRVTSYPLEDAKQISDNVIFNPDILHINGIVTDSPLTLLAPFNRSITAFNQLLQIHQEKQVINIITGIKRYENMIMTSLNVPRDMKTGQSLLFNMTFQKLFVDPNVRLELDVNRPFNKSNDIVNREQIKDNEDIPALNFDPPLSLKDQAQSTTNIGVQALRPIADNEIIETDWLYLKDF